mgnify:CR=1 FL=1
MSSNEVNTNFQRDQIAQVFKTPDMIRAFEALVRQATETTPAQSNATEEELYSVALSGMQGASQTRNAFIEIDNQAPHRPPNLTDIYRQLNEIKLFIGMT